VNLVVVGAAGGAAGGGEAHTTPLKDEREGLHSTTNITNKKSLPKGEAF
jgi:hypothetical protein